MIFITPVFRRVYNSFCISIIKKVIFSDYSLFIRNSIKKFKTNKFIAQETKEGLLIKPLAKDETVFYEDENGFGIYCESGLDIEKMLQAIKKLNKKDGQN